MNIGLLSETVNAFIGAFSGGFGRLGGAMGSLQHILLSLDFLWFGIMVLFGFEPVAGGLRKLLVASLWVYTIRHFDEMATSVVDSLVQGGLIAAGHPEVSPRIVMNPSLLMDGYFEATQPIANEVLKVGLLSINGTYLLFGFTLILMFIAYAALAVNAAVAAIEYYLALTVTGLLLPFGVLGPTRWVAMKPASYFLSTGLKLMVIACLTAISRDVLAQVKFPDAEPTFRQMLVAITTSGMLAFLCCLAPQRLAAGIMAGSASLGGGDLVRQAVSTANVATSAVRPLVRPAAAAGKAMGAGVALGGLAAVAGMRAVGNAVRSSGASAAPAQGNSAALAKASPVASAMTPRSTGGGGKPVFDGEFVDAAKPAPTLPAPPSLGV